LNAGSRPTTLTSAEGMSSADSARAVVEKARGAVAADVAELSDRIRKPVPLIRIRLGRQPAKQSPRAERTPGAAAALDHASADPGLTDLPASDYKSVFVRAVKRTMADNMASVGKGVAYGAFFAIPSAMIVALGVLNLTAGPGSIDALVGKLGGVVPASAQDLIRSNLQQVSRSHGGGVMVIVGLVLAAVSLMGAVQTVMWGLNVAYERREQRNFIRQRVSAFLITLIMTGALLAAFAVLVLGPYMTGWVGDASGYPRAVSWLWWTLQWPLLFAALLMAFGGILYLGPDVDHPRFRFITPGAVAAAVLWIVGSALFGVYASGFSSYNKAWGSLSAVIVTLTWLWLCSVAILFAAEVNAELERTREVHAGAKPSETLTADHK
jgi:membrane protein